MKTTDDLPPSASQWIEALAKAGKSASTIKGYRRGVVHFVAWYEKSGNMRFDPDAVLPRDVREWMTVQQKKEKALPATINQRLAGLSSFYRWATEEQGASHDPTNGIKPLRRSARRPHALPKHSLRRLRRTVHAGENLRDIALFEMLVGAGLRVSETLELRVSDVVLNERSGHVTIRRGKGGVQREVPLTSEVRHVVQAYLEAQPELEAEDRLWVGQRGPLKDPSGVNRMLEKYAGLAGVEEEVTPHVLRHTFATNYLRRHPGDIRNLAAILGHADLKTTMVYTVPNLEDLAQKMEEAEVG